MADLEALPFRRGALGGVWAHKCYMHIPADRVPLALADAHRALQVGGALHVHLTSDRNGPEARRPVPGRHFDSWPLERLVDVVVGAGFTIESTFDDGEEWIDVEAHPRSNACPTRSAPACACSWSGSTRASTRPTSATDSRDRATGSGPPRSRRDS